MAALKTAIYSHNDTRVLAWEQPNWINSTSVQIQINVLNKTTNKTTYEVSTFIVFPTSQDATNYVNAIANKTEYLLYRTESRGTGAYENVTGHAPQIYKEYVWNTGVYTSDWIIQADNLVRVSTINTLSSRE
ncbi:MAG: hypothetical protein WBZ42_08265 [Halobacteriota archaeon]